MAKITLTPLTDDDREQFILDNQRAFKYGAMEEFGLRDDHYEEDGEIISRETIQRCIKDGVAYRIREDGRSVGGVVLQIDEKTQHNHLDLLFVCPEAHSKGIGFAAWKEVERLYPDTKVWDGYPMPTPGRTEYSHLHFLKPAIRNRNPSISVIFSGVEIKGFRGFSFDLHSEGSVSRTDGSPRGCRKHTHSRNAG